MIPVLLRESSRCHQPCYHLEPQRREQAPWPSDRLYSCPQADGCHPDTEARTDPSPLGHFLEEGRNHELHHHKNKTKKPVWGSFVVNLCLLKLREEFFAEERLHTPPLQL